MDAALLNLSTKLSASSPQPQPSTPSTLEDLLEKRKFLFAAMEQYTKKPEAKRNLNDEQLNDIHDQLNGVQEQDIEHSKPNEHQHEINTVDSIPEGDDFRRLQLLVDDTTVVEDRLRLLQKLEERASDNQVSGSQILSMPKAPEGGFWKLLLKHLKSDHLELRQRMVALVGAVTDNDSKSQEAILDADYIPTLVEIATSETDLAFREKSIKTLIKAIRNHQGAFNAAQRNLPNHMKLKIAAHQSSTKIKVLRKDRQTNPKSTKQPPEANAPPKENPHHTNETKETEKLQSTEQLQDTANQDLAKKTTITRDEGPVASKNPLEDTSKVPRAKEELRVRVRYLSAEKYVPVHWFRNLLLAEAGLPELAPLEIEDEDESEDDSEDEGDTEYQVSPKNFGDFKRPEDEIARGIEDIPNGAMPTSAKVNLTSGSGNGAKILVQDHFNNELRNKAASRVNSDASWDMADVGEPMDVDAEVTKKM